jgi:uncharacterized protein
MEGPLSLVLKFDHATEMVVAVLVGMGFGLALERAGFGRATNLVANFYGRDFRVLRVMFTAIVTAMVGLYGLDLAGVLPLASIGLLDTFLGAQLAGGVLVGAGFIVGGYCPGTSIVAAVSGKIDALLFVVGVVVGSGVYALAGDALAPLAASGAMGRLLLHDALGVPAGPVVLGVALVAVGAFWGVGRIEAAVRRGLRAGTPGGGAVATPEGGAVAPREGAALRAGGSESPAEGLVLEGGRS